MHIELLANPPLQDDVNILRDTSSSHSHSGWVGREKINLCLSLNPNTLKFTYPQKQKHKYFGSEIPCTF